ncbi:MAG: hypothetical protein JO102_02945, partial [Elusimicrobia bacterium]|nr:hypothetical protein [Elusimicrobiota bacterium]
LGLAGVDERTVAVAYTDGGAAARVDAWEGFACSSSAQAPPIELALRVNELRTSGRRVERVIVMAPPAGFDRKSWAAALEAEIIVEPELSLDPEPVLNLLQGDYAPRPAWMKRLAPWRPAMTVAALGAAAAFLFNTVDAVANLRREQATRKQMEAVFASVFPDVKPPKDPARAMARQLDALRAQDGAIGAGDFLSLLSSLAAAGAGTQGGATLQRAEFENGRLIATMEAPTYAALERLRDGLKTQNLPCDLLGAESKDGRVVAKLRLGSAS